MTLEQLADRVSAALWGLHPVWAVEAGKHQYDGQVPDLSAGTIEASLERLGRLRAQLDELTGLAVDEQWEREVLLGVVARERFDLERAVRWRRDPAWYLEPLDVSVYPERDYAPGGLRLERAAALLGEAGGLLTQGRDRVARINPDTCTGGDNRIRQTVVGREDGGDVVVGGGEHLLENNQGLLVVPFRYSLVVYQRPRAVIEVGLSHTNITITEQGGVVVGGATVQQSHLRGAFWRSHPAVLTRRPWSCRPGRCRS